jgi:DNA invertase Pin-like site-specific DNA recombinase
MKNIIAYYRSSTKEQHYSIDVQRAQMQEYIYKNGFSLVAEYHEHHSGKDKTRIQLASAIKHCVNSGCTLAFTKLDRLSRQASHLYHIRDSGLDLICLDMPELNTLTFGIFATIAQHERELISHRTSSALQVIRQHKKLGNPNGWSMNKEKAQIARRAKRTEWLMSNEVVKARNIIELMNKNQAVSLSDIARNLNMHGITTQRGGLWNPNQVKLLINEIEQ